MKIVINKCYGGFSLSDASVKRLRELGSEAALKSVLTGEKYDDGSVKEARFGGDMNFVYIERNDPLLIKVVEELGKEAYGRFSKLEIIEIPDGVDWEIDDYDGIEWVAEKHETWR